MVGTEVRQSWVIVVSCPTAEGRAGASPRGLPRPVVDVARQHLALADVVGGADHALLLHALDDAGGSVVADLQVALDEAGRALALARHERDRLVVELVALAFLAALARQA